MNEDADWAADRRRLLAEIEQEAAETVSWTGRARFAQRTMDALAAVPRHAFVPSMERPLAYINRPLAIGHGQTISQPYIVALMTDLLDLEADSRVLEIGTGSGYQAAVLSLLCARVYTVEVVPALARAARERLARLGYDRVEVREGDGYRGWPEQAPFDGVIVTAAPPALPPALVEQLRPGGRIVIPIGPAGGTQVLYRGVKGEDGEVAMRACLPVAFVPMVPADD